MVQKIMSSVQEMSFPEKVEFYTALFTITKNYTLYPKLILYKSKKKIKNLKIGLTDREKIGITDMRKTHKKNIFWGVEGDKREVTGENIIKLPHSKENKQSCSGFPS